MMGGRGKWMQRQIVPYHLHGPLPVRILYVGRYPSEQYLEVYRNNCPYRLWQTFLSRRVVCQMTAR